jgi:hypothetical protein
MMRVLAMKGCQVDPVGWVCKSVGVQDSGFRDLRFSLESDHSEP